MKIFDIVICNKKPDLGRGEVISEVDRDKNVFVHFGDYNSKNNYRKAKVNIDLLTVVAENIVAEEIDNDSDIAALSTKK